MATIAAVNETLNGSCGTLVGALVPAAGAAVGAGVVDEIESLSGTVVPLVAVVAGVGENESVTGDGALSHREVRHPPAALS